MGEVKQENSPKSKSHLPQQDGLQETELLAQPGIPSTLGNQIISRIGNTPSQKAHADMLNRAPASNKQLLLQLQRQYGNSYVQQVVQQARQQDRPKIQAKLTIGEPGDKYEQEADRVARQVVQQIHAPVVPSGQSEAVQRQMPGEKDENQLQMKPMVQRQGEAGMDAAPDVEASINQAKGGGVAIANNIREPMEQAFGADFSGVKVHTDGQSDQLNQSIQARAFTTGQDVFFRQGEYQPGNRGGQELIAHELTHVVQQTREAGQRGRLDPGSNGLRTRIEERRTTTSEQLQKMMDVDTEIAAGENIQEVITHLNNFINTKLGVESNSTKYALKGGWEGWVQVELAEYLNRINLKNLNEREQAVYTNARQRSDLVLNTGHHTYIFEMKCESIMQTDTDGNRNKWVQALQADLTKLRNTNVQGATGLLLLVIVTPEMQNKIGQIGGTAQSVAEGVFLIHP